MPVRHFKFATPAAVRQSDGPKFKLAASENSSCPGPASLSLTVSHGWPGKSAQLSARTAVTVAAQAALPE